MTADRSRCATEVAPYERTAAVGRGFSRADSVSVRTCSSFRLDGSANYGPKAEVRQGPVPGHAAAGVRQRGDGLQRLSGAGDAALQPAVSVPDQAGHVGGAR